jgi:hypothetical protein
MLICMPSVHYFIKVRVRPVTGFNDCQCPIEKRHAELVTVFQQQQLLELQPLIVPSNEQAASIVFIFDSLCTRKVSLSLSLSLSLSGLTRKINMNT